MFRVFSGDDRQPILVCNRGEPKKNRLHLKGLGKTEEERGGCAGCSGGENLEGVKDVAGKQCKNCHHQDGFQLFVVRAGTTKVVA